MDPMALKELIYGSSIIAKCRGGKKGPIKEEEPCINFAFSTVVTTDHIRNGEELTTKNTWVKRP